MARESGEGGVLVNENTELGGQAALIVAVAHLEELLRTAEFENNRAMFLVGFNVASNSLFVAVVASLGQPWQAAVFPVAMALVTVTIGLRVLWNRRTAQFPSPRALLRARGRDLSNDHLAWIAVEAIEQASRTANGQVNWMTKWVTALQLLTLAHLVGLVTTGALLIAR